ncbi:MAG: hypothetical protein BMS9Abin20_1190 [Acidimicrobiia bacterium]|nr:MAG: hypothetical protein BMS9Abin20_1190 [Acidimicrobiia bacterium]
MNDSDIEIILALAQGRLSGQAEQDALSRIEADPELANELVIQMAAIESLQSVSTPTMTAEERATLRSNLIEQLHLEPTSAPASPVGRKVSWWQPVVGLASVALVVFAIVVVPGMFGSDADFTEVAAELSPAEGGGAPESVGTTFAAADSVARDKESTGGADGSESAPPELSNDIRSMSDEGFVNLYEVKEEDLPVLLDVITAADAPEVADEKLARAGFSSITAVDLAVLDRCLETLADELPSGSLIPLGATTSSGRQIVHLGVNTGDGIKALISIDIDTCVMTATNP